MRFKETFEGDNSGHNYNGFRVITDTHTGVQYLLRTLGDYSGLTVLLDKDGKPLINHGYIGK